MPRVWSDGTSAAPDHPEGDFKTEGSPREGCLDELFEGCLDIVFVVGFIAALIYWWAR